MGRVIPSNNPACIGIEAGGRHVPQNYDHDAMHGGNCVLHAIPVGVVQGKQASFKRLLGAVALPSWRRLDRRTTREDKTGDSRSLRTTGPCIAEAHYVAPTEHRNEHRLSSRSAARHRHDPGTGDRTKGGSSEASRQTGTWRG